MADTVMVDPLGRECTVGTPAEVNDLLCQGYTVKPRKAPRTEAPR